MALKLSLIHFIERDSLSLNYASTSSPPCRSLFLPVCPCFRKYAKPFGQDHRLLAGGSVRPRAGVGLRRILPTAAPTPTPAKTVDSDRLELRSRLRLRSPGLGTQCREILAWGTSTNYTVVTPLSVAAYLDRIGIQSFQRTQP